MLGMLLDGVTLGTHFRKFERVCSCVQCPGPQMQTNWSLTVVFYDVFFSRCIAVHATSLSPPELCANTHAGNNASSSISNSFKDSNFAPSGHLQGGQDQGEREALLLDTGIQLLHTVRMRYSLRKSFCSLALWALATASGKGVTNVL